MWKSVSCGALWLLVWSAFAKMGTVGTVMVLPIYRSQRRETMAISARNMFQGKVTALHEGPIHAEVELTTTAGDRIVATVTDASVKSLGIALGKEAVAVIKAPWVVLMTGEQEYRFSARNQLKGKVSKVTRGAVNSQIAVGLAGGSVVNAVITNEAADELGLKVGADTTAMFKASHVLLGVAA
jgi:molybdate transport system regulatory protein